MYLTVLSNFKTSYVEVYPFWVALIPAILLYFKTSYVEVYPSNIVNKADAYIHFKTSYVEVYRPSGAGVNSCNKFQNILC